jgi:hypothetical protein
MGGQYKRGMVLFWEVHTPFTVEIWDSHVVVVT